MSRRVNHGSTWINASITDRRGSMRLSRIDVSRRVDHGLTWIDVSGSTSIRDRRMDRRGSTWITDRRGSTWITDASITDRRGSRIDVDRRESTRQSRIDVDRRESTRRSGLTWVDGGLT